MLPSENKDFTIIIIMIIISYYYLYYAWVAAMAVIKSNMEKSLKRKQSGMHKTAYGQ